MLKSIGYIVTIILLLNVLSCGKEPNAILGKWEMQRSSLKNGNMVLTFLPENNYTIVYRINNKLHTEIKNVGNWKLNKEASILELVNHQGEMVEKYKIVLLSQDSLVWVSLNSKRSEDLQLFLKQD